MKVFQGKGVCGGIFMGRIRLYRKQEQPVRFVPVEDTEAEVARYRAASETAAAQLQELFEEANRGKGAEHASIFRGHKRMLTDEDYCASVEQIIRSQQANAEYAVEKTAEMLSDMFASMDDACFRERASDVKDISRRLIRVLKREEETQNRDGEEIILLAEDLTPSETIRLDNSRIKAFVTIQGSPLSHTAILAGTLGIPALVGTGLSMEESLNGALGIVDGSAGLFYVEPDADTIARLEAKQQAEKVQSEMIHALEGKETVTRDGRKIHLYANIGDKRELDLACENDAEGIGLFRTEVLFLGKERCPTEEEQLAIYKTCAEAMKGKTVVIRTLDIGAEKNCPGLTLHAETNPAMGLRGICVCLTHPEIFRTQLRALLRASVYGNIAIMYPMIISEAELHQVKCILQEVRNELAAEGIPFGNPKQGILIETPAAALISDLLAKEVDFFSIGTNDLAQYTLAIDRQNAGLDAFYDAHHPAVMRQIRMVVEHAKKAGIRVGICGELGADPELVKEFLNLGVDVLSLSPGSILPLRKVIRETDLSET